MDTVISTIVGIGTAALSWKFFFKDLEDFMECIKYWLTPDIISMFRGEFHEDWWAEMKLGFWIAVSMLCGIGTFQALH